MSTQAKVAWIEHHFGTACYLDDNEVCDPSREGDWDTGLDGPLPPSQTIALLYEGRLPGTVLVMHVGLDGEPAGEMVLPAWEGCSLPVAPRQ